jgi:hypothetical protein
MKEEIKTRNLEATPLKNNRRVRRKEPHIIYKKSENV